jgi:nitric oxide reductase subunit B
MTVSEPAQPREDRVSNVLKWVLLGIAIITFGVRGWATDVTYRTAPPPQPEKFLAPDGGVLMSADDISDGKASFQQADLMDYTAEYLNRLGAVTADNIAAPALGRLSQR